MDCCRKNERTFCIPPIASVGCYLSTRRNVDSLWSSRTLKQWNICCLSAMSPMLSSLNRSRTPRRLFVKSGSVRRTLFSDTLLHWADEWNTILTWSGFFGWYTLKIGKNQHSSSSFNGGASSACFTSNIRCIKVSACSHLNGFFFRLLSSIVAHFNACSLLSGGLYIGSRNGNGATTGHSHHDRTPCPWWL